MALFAAMSTGVRADVPLGDYTIDFDNGTPFWDISGSYTQTVDGVDLDYTLVADQYGKVTGLGTATVDVGLNVIVFDFDLTGTVKGSGAVTRVSFSMKMKSDGIIEGYDYEAKMGLAVKSEIETARLAMVGSIKGKLVTNIRKYDKKTFEISQTDMVLDLPIGMDGSWTLDTSIFSLNGKIGNSQAEITLSNGWVYPFIMKGTHVPATDITSMELKGGETNKKMSASFKAIFTGTAVNVKSFKGKALGQSRSYTAPVVPTT